MATSPEEDDKAAAGQPKRHDHQQAAHLDKVTDYVEEQEIKGDMGKVQVLHQSYVFFKRCIATYYQRTYLSVWHVF